MRYWYLLPMLANRGKPRTRQDINRSGCLLMLSAFIIAVAIGGMAIWRLLVP
jgi:hypothetical protein